jgi:hypothetical protein
LRAYRAWPSQPILKNCQNGTFFTRGLNLNFQVDVDVHIQVDESKQMEISQKSLTGIKKLFLFYFL